MIDVEIRQNFIATKSTGYYMGVDEQDNEVVIYVEQGIKMIKTILTIDGEQIIEVYDKDGIQIIEQGE